MKYNYYVSMGLILLTATTALSMQAPRKAHQAKLTIPGALRPFMKIRNGREYQGKAVAWLKVPGQGHTLIQLQGKSYYKPSHRPKDFTISYIGHDTNGVIHRLPKGLYFWKNRPRTGGVMPAAGNKYENQEFDWVWNTPNDWALFSTTVPIEKTLRWNPARVAHLHPSKQISDAFKNL